jgi:hypothetical protein
VFDSIDDYKSVVYLSIYRGGGLDPLQTNFRAYPEIFANKHSKKLGTLICSAPARTVRPQGQTIRALKMVLNRYYVGTFYKYILFIYLIIIVLS